MGASMIDNSDVIKYAFEQAVLKALTTCGLEAQKYARNLCPTVTSLLKNSIAYAVGGETPSPQQYSAKKADSSGKIQSGEYNGQAPEDTGTTRTVYIGSKVEYAPCVELGTYKQRAEPFLKPAIADHVDKYRQIIQKELKGD